MKARLGMLWESRSPRQRVIITLLAVVLAVILYGWLVNSAAHARVELRHTVSKLHAQAMRLDREAAEFIRLRAAPAASVSSLDLQTLVQTRIDDAGLTSALTAINAAGPNQVKVAFGALPFADWLAWVATLQAQQVRLESCRIEALAAPGLVSVSATFVRAGT